MPLLADRVRGLLTAKRIRQNALDGVTASELGKWLCGDRQPAIDDLRRLAIALEATSDYLIGLGESYGDSYELAAAKMAYAFFHSDMSISGDHKASCRRIYESDAVLVQPGAPRTALEWRTVALMVAIGAPPAPRKIEAVRSA